MFSLANLQNIYGLSNNINNNNNNNSNKPSLVERIKENVLHSHKDNHNTMKWSSSSSSLSSTGDRRSVFYTDSDLVPNEKITDIDATDLRAKLQNTEESLEMQVRKCENLISFFTSQIKSLTAELKSEKSWRTNQLTKIVKALLCFEARLKNDQKLIRRQLYEKDSEINRLSREITVLKERYGDTTEIDVCEVAQYCPTCRKQYYLLETKNVAVQVHKRGINTDTSSTQHVDCLSSSEEGVPSFAEARRSKKYMSKRTSGTFRDYLRSRSNDTKECGTATFNRNTNNSDDNENQKKENDRKNKENIKRSSMNSGSYSTFINNMHGLKTCTNSEQNSIQNYENSSNMKSSNDDDDEVFGSSNNSFLKKYKIEDVIARTQFESTDDWYASASDMDDSDSALSKTYGQNAVNPVLECVNQILLQQSIDGILISSPSPEANEPLPKEPNLRQKRVHFSTQNSMVQVPRTECSFQTTSTIEEASHKEQSFSYESVYSNEYEPIGSENNSSNYYVDMELKNEPKENTVKTEKSKIPPALPPKPANLMKLRQVLKITAVKTPATTKDMTEIIDNESEPDYCSISEVNEAIKNFQIVADVHKNADEMSTASEETKTDGTDETFADIPKLPNVAAIISPKKEVITKFIAQDNYITKSPVKHLENKQVSFILNEINSKKPAPNITKIPKMTTISETKPSLSVKILDDKMPIQAEFDWYNLDVEYGKINPPDVIRESDVNEADFTVEQEEKDDEIAVNNVGVEYNLDEEFILGNPPDIIEKNLIDHPESPKRNNKFNHLDSDKPQKTFESFLSDTGLTTKPLPRKRKIYYTAPFV